MHTSNHVKNTKDVPGWKTTYTASVIMVLAAVFGINFSLQWRQTTLPLSIIWIEIIIAAALVIFLFISMIRKKTSTMWWEVVLVLLAFFGAWIAMLAALPVEMAIIAAAVLVVSAFIWPRTWINALLFFFGCTGIGLLAALQFPFEVMFLSSLSVLVYDYLRSKEVHMATLFSEAWLAGVTPGLLLPIRLSDWPKSISEVWKPGRGQIVGLLPFMLIAGMGFHLIAKSPWLALGYAGIISVAGGLFGQTKQGYLRTWVFLAAGVASYFMYGMIRIFL